MAYGQKQEGRIGAMNSWVIETLREDDVIVIDLFDKVYEGTYSGANLSTAIATRTKRGQVIYGGIRDAPADHRDRGLCDLLPRHGSDAHPQCHAVGLQRSVSHRRCHLHAG